MTESTGVNEILVKQEGEKNYPYLASLYDMYVLDGVKKMTTLGLEVYIKEYCPFMPEKLQSLLRNMDIGDQLSKEDLHTILSTDIFEELLKNPKTW